MSQTFNFEELDQNTHDYLVAVRDAEGGGTPGVFVPSSDSLPGCGCVVGPIVIATTLALTLTDWVDVIQYEPRAVALLQTAGLLVGGWLLAAGFRGSKGSDKVAGCWAYVDPLYLYEAFREQVTVTPVDDVIEAQFTHNYNNGSYQNSVVTIRLSGNNGKTLNVSGEAPAERMVVYLNYLAWARGGEGGDRANLPPATLGGLAKYVAKNDAEPLDNENNINLSQIDLDVTEVPEEPFRDRTATPAFLPYVVMLVAAVVSWCAFAFVVNPPLRDDVVYNAVSKDPVQPIDLRAYLLDDRNTKHRDKVRQRLQEFYDVPTTECRTKGKNPALGEGMAKMFGDLSTAPSPAVTLKVTERASPPELADGRAAREAEFGTLFSNAMYHSISAMPGLGIPPLGPNGRPWRIAPAARGYQLIEFLAPPEGAPAALIEIDYTIESAGNAYTVKATVAVRLKVTEEPIARGSFGAPKQFTADQLTVVPQREGIGPDKKPYWNDHLCPEGLRATRQEIVTGMLGRFVIEPPPEPVLSPD
jgi:hypothetical protein